MIISNNFVKSCYNLGLILYENQEKMGIKIENSQESILLIGYCTMILFKN